MKIKHLIGAFLVALTVISCKKDKLTIQQYLVDTQNKENFMNMNFSSSMLSSYSNFMNEEEKELVKSVGKVNLTGLPIKSDNKAQYEKEKALLISVLDNAEDYTNLMRVKSKELSFKIYYKGDNPESVDEIIAFGFSDEKGLGVARLLGENMNLPKIMEKIQNSSMSGKSEELKKIQEVLKKEK